MKKIHLLIISLILTSVLIIFFFTQISLGDIQKPISQISWWLVPLGFVLYVIGSMTMAVRFKVLLGDKINITDLICIVSIHNFFNNLLPARTGELSYIYMLRRKKIFTGESTTSLFIVRTMDIISMAFLSFIARLLIHNLSPLISHLVLIIVIFALVFIVFLISLIFFGNKLLDLLEKIVTKLQFRFTKFIIKKSREIMINLSNVKSKKIFLYIFLLSLISWMIFYFLDYILVSNMGISIGFWTIVLAAILSTFGFLLPIQGIGGFGTFEAIWAIVLVSSGSSKEIAISSGLSLHIITFIFALLFSLYGFWMLKFKS